MTAAVPDSDDTTTTDAHDGLFCVKVGDRVVVEQTVQSVMGIDTGGRCRVISDRGIITCWSVADLDKMDGFAVVGQGPRPVTEHIGMWWHFVPERYQKQATERAAHLREVLYGEGINGRDVPDDLNPKKTPNIEDRFAAKARDAERMGIRGYSVASLWRWKVAYENEGTWGLVAKPGRDAALAERLHEHSASPDLIDAIADQVEAEINDSTGTRKRFRRRVEKRLTDKFGEGVVALPSATHIEALVNRMTAGTFTFSDATTRRSAAHIPVEWNGFHPVTRAGEIIEIDGTTFDVRVTFYDGTDDAVTLVIALDVWSHSIVAFEFVPGTNTNATHMSYLVGQMRVPEPMRPGWADSLRYAYERFPLDEMTALDARFADAAARPVICPETIVVDRAKFNMGLVFEYAMARQRVNLQPARPGNPTDKPHVERAIQTIHSEFAQYIEGYKARTTTRRGKHVEGVFSIDELHELFALYVIGVWQNRPIDGLRSPYAPVTDLSPNQMINLSAGVQGYVWRAFTDRDWVRMLPFDTRSIQRDGINYENLKFNCPALQQLRRDLKRKADGGSVEMVFHYDPNDWSCGYVWDEIADDYLRVPCMNVKRTGAVLSEAMRKHVEDHIDVTRRKKSDAFDWEAAHHDLTGILMGDPSKVLLRDHNRALGHATAADRIRNLIGVKDEAPMLAGVADEPTPTNPEPAVVEGEETLAAAVGDDTTPVPVRPAGRFRDRNTGGLL